MDSLFMDPWSRQREKTEKPAPKIWFLWDELWDISDEMCISRGTTQIAAFPFFRWGIDRTKGRCRSFRLLQAVCIHATITGGFYRKPDFITRFFSSRRLRGYRYRVIRCGFHQKDRLSAFFQHSLLRNIPIFSSSTPVYSGIISYPVWFCQ